MTARGRALAILTALSVFVAGWVVFVASWSGPAGAGPGRGFGVAGARAAGLDLRRHVRELELDRLEVADPLPEGAPLQGIAASDVEGGLRDPDGLRGDADAAAVEGRHRDGEPLPLLV